MHRKSIDAPLITEFNWTINILWPTTYYMVSSSASSCSPFYIGKLLQLCMRLRFFNILDIFRSLNFLIYYLFLFSVCGSGIVSHCKI